MSGVLVYVDGTNLITQMLKILGEGEDKFEFRPHRGHLHFASYLTQFAVEHTGGGPTLRRYWYSSINGSPEDLAAVRGVLRFHFNFEPKLFTRTRNNKEKGVDITLARDMLVNAFNRNSSRVVLIAGDQDYLPLVDEVKRHGIQMTGAFFEAGLSPELKVAYDSFLTFPTDINTLSYQQRLSTEFEQERRKPLYPQKLSQTKDQPLP